VKLDPGSGLTERFVTARGRRMRTVQAGSGTPLVVFESGLAAAASVWSDVQRRVSAHTATLSYDRAGIGGSKRARDGRRFADLNADLEAVLDALGHDGPVLLVGQSWGGPIVRAFSHFTTRPVAGLVIVDGTRSQVLTSKEGKALRVYFGLLGKLSRLGLHRRFRAKLLVGITGGLSDEDGARVLRDMLRGNAARAGAAECKGLAEEADELGALEARGFPAGVPVTFLGAGHAEPGTEEMRDRFLAGQRKEAERLRQRFVLVTGSRHDIHMHRPDVVAAEIVAQMRGGARAGSSTFPPSETDA
jgi:pimeloyl-ACP methyl ester carboxylesterase